MNGGSLKISAGTQTCLKQSKINLYTMTMPISDRIKEDLQTFYEKHLFEYSLNDILFSPIFYYFLLYLYKSCTSFCLHTYVSNNTFTHTHTHTNTHLRTIFPHNTPPIILISLSLYLSRMYDNIFFMPAAT